ncbi:MAG: hypothetical protein IJ635_00720 [Bacteroidaceae bacterium]|nr:hypothetical protein [Bacteroidaceae bacterium]
MDTFCFPQKVIYDDVYPKVNYIKERVEGDKDVTRALWHKAPAWGYEKEYRVIAPRVTGLSEFNKDALVGIVFGCRCKEKDETKIVKKMEAGAFEDVKLMRAVQSETAYQLNIQDY